MDTSQLQVIHLWFSTITLGVLALIWKSNGLPNLFVKAALFTGMLIGIVLLVRR